MVGWVVDRFAAEVSAEHLWLLPVVAETYDGMLNDIMGRHVREEHVRAALDDAAPGSFPLGAVGGGTGMIAYEMKGGTGSSSRVLDLVGGPYTLGVLVQANHGRLNQFQVAGVPVGRALGASEASTSRETGSIIVIVATDAPLLPHQLQRVARRDGLGVGRLGAIGGNSSGDIFLALSTATPAPMPPPQPVAVQPLRCLTDTVLDPIYDATVSATEEAVLDAMLMAEPAPTFRPKGNTVPALNGERLVELLRRHRAMDDPARDSEPKPLTLAFSPIKKSTTCLIGAGPESLPDLGAADRALARLDGVIVLLPRQELFLCIYVCKEAVLSPNGPGRRRPTFCGLKRQLRQARNAWEASTR